MVPIILKRLATLVPIYKKICNNLITKKVGNPHLIIQRDHMYLFWPRSYKKGWLPWLQYTKKVGDLGSNIHLRLVSHLYTKVSIPKIMAIFKNHKYLQCIKYMQSRFKP